MIAKEKKKAEKEKDSFSAWRRLRRRRRRTMPPAKAGRTRVRLDDYYLLRIINNKGDYVGR